MRAAVLGATGFVGRALVPALAQRGEVLALSRRPPVADRHGVRAVAADVTRADGLRGALEGVDVAYHLIPSLGSRAFAELDRRAAENVAVGYGSGSDTVRVGWMQSPAHRSNVLTRGHRLTAVGAHRDGAGLWWTVQLFGRR